MDTDGFQFANPIDELTYMYDTNKKKSSYLHKKYINLY